MTFAVTRILRLIEKKIDGPTNYLPYANQMQVEDAAGEHYSLVGGVKK
jgi:hypothetical protein